MRILISGRGSWRRNVAGDEVRTKGSCSLIFPTELARSTRASSIQRGVFIVVENLVQAIEEFLPVTRSGTPVPPRTNIRRIGYTVARFQDKARQDGVWEARLQSIQGLFLH